MSIIKYTPYIIKEKNILIQALFLSKTHFINGKGAFSSNISSFSGNNCQFVHKRILSCAPCSYNVFNCHFNNPSIAREHMYLNFALFIISLLRNLLQVL